MTALLILASVLAFDLGPARNEPNLERRSDAALKNADAQVTAAREAYNTADMAAFKTALAEVQESVELSLQSLIDSGKNPRGSNSFKKAELMTRQMMRRLDTLHDTMSVVDRELVQPVRERVAEVHEMLLTGIMSKKKK